MSINVYSCNKKKMEFKLPWKKSTRESTEELKTASRTFDLELDLQQRLHARKMTKLTGKLAALPMSGKARQLILGDIKTETAVMDSMLSSALLVHKLDGAAKTTITKIHAIVAANDISAIAANIEQPPGTSLKNAMREHANTARTNEIISQIDTISTLNDDDSSDGGDSEQLYDSLPSVPKVRVTYRSNVCANFVGVPNT